MQRMTKCAVWKRARNYAEVLEDSGVPFEMHVFPTGGHGFGLGRAEDGTDQWMDLATNWVKRLKQESAMTKIGP